MASLPLDQLLAQIRQHCENAEAKSTELEAENESLRYYLNRSLAFNRPLPTPAGLGMDNDSIAATPDGAVTRTTSGVSVSLAVATAAVEGKDAEALPKHSRNQRRRPSGGFSTQRRRPVPHEPVAQAGGDAPNDSGSLSRTRSGTNTDDGSGIGGPTKALLEEVPESGPASAEQPGSTQSMSLPANGSDDDASVRTGNDDDDDDLQLHSVWTELRRRSTFSPGRRMARRNTYSFKESHSPSKLSNGTTQSIAKHDCVFHPNRAFINLWDIIIIVVLVYDFVFVPLQAFELPSSSAFAAMELATTSVWTLDMVLCFFRGIESNGIIEMRHRRIVRSYLTTWFIFDVTVVAMDWALFVSVNEGGLVDATRASRLRRLVRLMRLARLLKHGRRFLSLLSPIRSGSWLVVFRMVWLTIVLVGINHFVCCGWYAIGNWDVFHESWALRAFEPEDSLGYRYSTSFHWAVTQFTPASMEVVPTNAMERVYNIVLIFFGLLLFSAFVSDMTSSLMYLTQQQIQKVQQRELLQTYISNKNLSMELSNDVIKQVGISSQKKSKRLLEADIACLAEMPNGLRERLHHEVHCPVLQEHPLFQVIEDKDPECLRAMCHNAMAEWASCVEGEEIFRFGQQCKGMMFIVAGQFTYVGGLGGSRVFEDMHYGSWLCEACLWVKWEHRGSLTSASEGCELALLNMADFHLVFSRARIHDEMRRYARLYAQCISQESRWSDLVNDTWGQQPWVASLVQRVFRDMEDVDEGAAKILNFWSLEPFSDRNVFRMWKTVTRREQRLRRGGLRGVGYRLLHRARLLDRFLL